MKAVVFKGEILKIWATGVGTAIVNKITFGSRGPFPDGVKIVDVVDIGTDKPTGDFIDGWGKPVLKDGKVTRTQVWTPAPEKTPIEQHKDRLAHGIEWKGKRYPCLKKDRDGINSVIAGFDTSEKLFQKWIKENGPPTSNQETENMVLSGAVPPAFRSTDFQWSNGEFLTLNESDAVAVAGKMSIAVSRSFSQLKATDLGISE